MLITSVEKITSSKSKVFVDEEFAFVLYKGELSRFNIEVENELDDIDFEKIKKEIIIKRAKKRVLHLLEQMPRTEYQVRLKLKQGYYTEDVVDEAINYAKKFSYIQDENYCRVYVSMKMESKSRKEIYASLMTKGVRKEIVEEIFEELYEDHSNEEMILKLIHKKSRGVKELDDKQIMKINAYLIRKGFSYDELREAFEKYLNDREGI